VFSTVVGDTFYPSNHCGNAPFLQGLAIGLFFTYTGYSLGSTAVKASLSRSFAG
jgi:hypothetical protein